MIYLFCNEGYGAPFMRAAVDWARRRGSTDLTIVFSSPLPRGQGFIKDALRRSRLVLKGIKRSAQYGSRSLFVPDVNSPAFYRRIRPADHGIIAGFNQIFRQPLIGCFGSIVNFHPSVLPLYRGPVPSAWCIKNGETSSGYTLHRVTERIDEGEILYQEEVSVGGEDEAGLDGKIAACGAVTLVRYLEQIKTGRDWDKVVLDARSIYRTHLTYASFAEKRD